MGAVVCQMSLDGAQVLCADIHWSSTRPGVRRGQRTEASKVRLDSRELRDGGAQANSEVGLNQRVLLGDQSSVSCAGGAQKKRKAVVRKESADAQEYERGQRNDMDVDADEDKEELSFAPSAVSGLDGVTSSVSAVDDVGKKRVQLFRHRSSAWRRERRATHDEALRRLLPRKARREEGAEGEPQAGWREEITSVSWQLAPMGVEHKIMEIYASKKIYAEDLLKEAAAALNVGTLVLNGSPHKRKSWLCCRVARPCNGQA